MVEQLEPLLGPAGRPMGDTAMALWRRRRVDAYLALPPWRRARRTWVSWGTPGARLAVLALAPLWTVVCLPLRMLGLASLEASQVGVAAIAVAAPLVARRAAPPRGRFAGPLPRRRAAVARVARAAPPPGSSRWRGVCGAGASSALLAVLGPGPAAPAARPDHPGRAPRRRRGRRAGAAVAQCAASPPVGGDHAGRARRYRASLAGGAVATVAMRPAGLRRRAGARVIRAEAHRRLPGR